MLLLRAWWARGAGGWGEQRERKTKRRRRIRSTGKGLADRARQQSPIMQHHNLSYTHTYTNVQRSEAIRGGSEDTAFFFWFIPSPRRKD
jgi:hypothetical protein